MCIVSLVWWMASSTGGSPLELAPRTRPALLKKQYSLKNTRPIVRALLSPNPKQALERLCPLPRLGSFFGATMRDHIALMKSMGHRYEEDRLLRFDRFLQSRPDLSGQRLNTLIREWSRSGSRPSHILEAQQVGRILAKILRRFDPSAELFVSDRRAERLAHRAYRRPYIYTEDQIRCVLKAAREFHRQKRRCVLPLSIPCWFWRIARGCDSANSCD